jgi:hypothetical protein
VRPTGFYWIWQGGAEEPEVARWEHECWWVTGERRQVLDEDVRVLQACVLPHDWQIDTNDCPDWRHTYWRCKSCDLVRRGEPNKPPQRSSIFSDDCHGSKP